MVLSSQRTIHWLSIILDMSIGKRFKALDNTTLNEKFELDTDLHIEEGSYPTLKYFTIGVGGEPITDASDVYKFSRHSAIDGSLYNQIPFAIKLPDEDLTLLEQAEYRFKKKILIDNVEYFAYYLKVIPKPDLRDFYYEITTDEGTSTLGVFNNNTDKILNPEPIEKHNRLTNVEQAKYISKLIKFFFILNKNEVDNLLEVISLLNLDATHINEIGICSGKDVEIDNMMHAVDVQMAYIMDTDLFLATDMLSDEKINLWLEVGGSEPLFL